MIHGFENHFAVLKHKIMCLQLRMNESSKPCTKNQSTNLQVKQVIGLQSTNKNCFKSCLQSTIILLTWYTINKPNYGQIYKLKLNKNPP